MKVYDGHIVLGCTREGFRWERDQNVCRQSEVLSEEEAEKLLFLIGFQTMTLVVGIWHVKLKAINT